MLINDAQDTWDALTCEVGQHGVRRWYDENGNLHRENNPASIWPDGSRFWFKHGKRHREDGPAVIWFDGEVEYYLNDLWLTEEQFNARKLTVNE